MRLAGPPGTAWNGAVAPLANRAGLFERVESRRWPIPLSFWNERTLYGRIGGKVTKRMIVLFLSFLLAASAYAQMEDFSELVKNGSAKSVQAAIGHGADVNAWDKDDLTPLMEAAGFTENMEVITMLLKAGAHINAQNISGETPLMLAASRNQNPEVIMTLIKSGANIEERNLYGATALMYAAANNTNAAAIGALLAAGADVNAQDENLGLTPLMYAAKSNPNPQVILALLNAGADARARDGAGKTAFDYAQNNAQARGSAGYRQLQEASQ